MGDTTPIAAIAIALCERGQRTEPLERSDQRDPPLGATCAAVLASAWRLREPHRGAGSAALRTGGHSRPGGPRPMGSVRDPCAIEAATIVDARVQPDRERELISRWAQVAFYWLAQLQRISTAIESPISRASCERALVAD